LNNYAEQKGVLSGRAGFAVDAGTWCVGAALCRADKVIALPLSNFARALTVAAAAFM